MKHLTADCNSSDFNEALDTPTLRVSSLIKQCSIISKAIVSGTSINGIINDEGELISPVLFAATLQDPRLMEQCITCGASTEASSKQFASPLHALFNLSRDKANAHQLVATLALYYRTQCPHSLETILIEQLSFCLPLIKAAAMSDEKLVLRCLQYGLNVNAQDGQGRTALMLAAKENCHPAIEYLLDYGADTTIRDTMGRCAVDFVTNEFGDGLKKVLAINFYVKNDSVPLQYRPVTEAVKAARLIHEQYSVELAKLDKLDTQLEQPIPPQAITLRPKNPAAKKRHKK